MRTDLLVSWGTLLKGLVLTERRLDGVSTIFVYTIVETPQIAMLTLCWGQKILIGNGTSLQN